MFLSIFYTEMASVKLQMCVKTNQENKKMWRLIYQCRSPEVSMHIESYDLGSKVKLKSQDMKKSNMSSTSTLTLLTLDFTWTWALNDFAKGWRSVTLDVFLSEWLKLNDRIVT